MYYKPDYHVFIDTHGILGVPLYMETTYGAFQKIYEELHNIPVLELKDVYRTLTHGIYAIDIIKMFDGLQEKQAWAIELWGALREDLHYLLVCRNILFKKDIISVDQNDKSKTILSF